MAILNQQNIPLVIALLASVLCVSNLSYADLDTSSESLDRNMKYSDEIINSLPKMPPTTEKPGLPKLQIGIKKRAENCLREAKKGDTLHMHYSGSLKSNGVEFDNSYKRGQPLTFVLGVGSVIQGWDQGLLGICAGEKRKLIIPPHLAYGEHGSPPTIPPQSALVFEVEAVKVEASNTKNRDDL